MQPVIEWLKHNKEWVFSGAGLVAGGWILSWLRFATFVLAPARLRRFRLISPSDLLAYGSELSDQMLLFTVGNRANSVGVRWHQLTKTALRVEVPPRRFSLEIR